MTDFLGAIAVSYPEIKARTARSYPLGEDVLISGFGKFCVKKKHQRKGRNPLTGESLMLKARGVVTFRCSPVLKGKMNGKR